MKIYKPITTTFFVILLAAPLVGQQLLYTFTGEADSDKLGFGVSLLNDINDDGWDDLFIGAPFHDGTKGRGYVYSGKDGQLLYAFDGGERADRLGISGSSAGDVDRDGTNDFMIGSIAGGIVTEGDVSVYSGRTGLRLRQYTGAYNGDIFGGVIERIGDLDGDGDGDHLIAAWNWAPCCGDDSRGKVYAYSSRTGALLREWKGEQMFDHFGLHLATVGDIDGDAVSDFAISARLNYGYDWERGKVYVYSGKTLSLIYSKQGTEDFHQLEAAAGLGDLDSDGYAELLIGGAGAKSFAGSAYIYAGPDGALLHTIYGTEPKSGFGYSVANAGDVDADGMVDFLVGEPYGGGIDVPGRAYLYTSRNFRLLYRFSGNPNQVLGLTLSPAGDIDRDGLADFMIGAPGDDGAVYVYSGNDLFLQAENTAVSEGHTLRLFTRGGGPHALMTLALVEIAGNATYQPLVTARLNQYGEQTFETIIPPGMSGLDLAFQSFAEKPILNGNRGTLRGGTADSALERVEIQ